MKKYNREFVFLVLSFFIFSCSADKDSEFLHQKYENRLLALERKYDDRLLAMERTISKQNVEIATLKSLVEKQEQKIKKLGQELETDEGLSNDEGLSSENDKSNLVKDMDAGVRNGSKSYIQKVRRLLMPSTQPPVSEKAEVAFFAERISVLANMGNYQSIVYDQVKVNHGSAYSGVDGEFLAPVGGIYVFSWTSSNGDNTHMVTEMVINGKRYAHTWTDSGNHADYSVASVTCVAELKKDDRVWIRSADTHSRTLTCNDYSMCSFTGFLLY